MGSVFYNTPQRLKSVRDTILEIAELQASVDPRIRMTALNILQESFSGFDAFPLGFLVEVNGIAPIHRDRSAVGERILVHCYLSPLKVEL